MKKNIIFVILLLCSLLMGCGGGGGDGGGTSGPVPPEDTIAPWVNFTTPFHTATGVFINSAITATFSEAMDPTTIDGSTFTVDDGVTAVQGTVSYDATNQTAIFAPPIVGLAADTTYTATVTTGMMDLAGNPIANDYSWSFTTGNSADNTAPTVLFTFPVDGANGVALNTAIAVTFSEQMSPATITEQTFTLSDGSAVAGTVTYIGASALFKPSNDLSPNTTYTAEIAGGINGVWDLAGNPMAAAHSFSFTTGAAQDTTPPQVVSTNPADGDQNVPLDTPVSVTFDEPMLPFYFGLINERPVSVMFDSEYKTFTIQPPEGLVANSFYRTSLQVKDMAGNLMNQPYTWSFTTVP